MKELVCWWTYLEQLEFESRLINLMLEATDLPTEPQPTAHPVKIFVQRLFQRQHFWREKIRSRDWYDLDWLTLCPIQLVIQTRSIWDQSYKILSSLIHWKKQPIGALKTSLRGKFTRENLFTRSGHFKNGIFHQLEGANVTLMGQYLRPDQCDQKKVAKFL